MASLVAINSPSMCAINSTMSSTWQNSYCCGRTFGGASGLRRFDVWDDEDPEEVVPWVGGRGGEDRLLTGDTPLCGGGWPSFATRFWEGCGAAAAEGFAVAAGGRGDFAGGGCGGCEGGFCERDDDESLFCGSMAEAWTPESFATYCRGR